MDMHRYRDRREAGRHLGELVERRHPFSNPLILALPRGGVPVGYEVARRLKASMDVFVVRKLGVPGHEEFAMGAIASGGVRIINQETLDQLGISDRDVAYVAAEQQRELERREVLYRGAQPPLELRDREVILVDDGLATGSTMRAAIAAVRAQHPAHLTVAVPVAAREVCEELRAEVDEVICAETPDPFYSVGLWYEDFDQTDDAEVRELLSRAAREQRDTVSRTDRRGSTSASGSTSR